MLQKVEFGSTNFRMCISGKNANIYNSNNNNNNNNKLQFVAGTMSHVVVAHFDCAVVWSAKQRIVTNFLCSIPFLCHYYFSLSIITKDSKRSDATVCHFNTFASMGGLVEVFC